MASSQLNSSFNHATRKQQPHCMGYAGNVTGKKRAHYTVTTKHVL